MKEKPMLERHKEEMFDCAQYSSITRSNCEQVTLICLDNQLGQTSQFTNDFHITEEMLRELNDYVLLFSSESECLVYIESIKSETILLIVAGSSASPNLLEKTHNIRHVDSIFIFCQNKKTYEPLLLNKDYYKLVGVFNEREVLASKIADSIELFDKQSAIFALYNTDKQKSTRNLSRESGSFIFLQLVKQVLQKMLSNKEAIETSKQEMLDKCRLYYRGNKKAMQDIDEFEREYTSDQAIKWYTANSFLYRLINKALRTEDIDALYTYRFYIVDLCTCLAEQSKELYDSTSNVHVYRGVKMSQKEIERLRESVGHLISVNAYFSTSRQLEVSEAYAGIGSINISNDFDSVVFHIEVDLEKYPETILADVRHLSKFKDEDEVLFDIGTVFKILSMEYSEQQHFWQCQITASNEGRTIGKEYLDLKQIELNESNDIESTFGDLLFDMGEWLKSCTYFQNLKERRPNDPYILFGIGRSYCKFDNLNQGLSYCKAAYDLCMKNDNKRLTLAGKICHFMCRLHDDCSNYREALSCGNEAIDLYREAGEEDNQLGIAQALTAIGIVYYDQGNDDASLEYFQRAYSIVKHIYAFDHPETSVCLNYLAFAYYHKGDYDKSLDCMLECLTIDQKLLPSDHPTMFVIENNIGKQYYKQGKYEEALERLIRIGDVYSHTEKCNPCNRVVTYNNIGKALYRLKKLNEADVYYEKALHAIEELFPSTPDHINLAYTLKNMGEIQLARGDVTNALHLFERAHDMYERLFARDGDHRDIAKCKYLIALTHVECGNDEEASKAFEKALQMWTNVLPKNHPDLALCHRSMAEYYINKKHMEERAIMHFQMALAIYEKRRPNAHQDFIGIRNKLCYLKNRQQLQMFSKILKHLFLQISSHQQVLFELFYIVNDSLRRLL
jgi:tetratricopeptide (TPR) repeat protein